MMKFILSLLVATFFLSPVISQNFKYGKVSKAELSEAQNSMFPDADATVLYREHKCYYKYRQGEGFTLYTEVFERIKIYNNEGFDWADQSFRTYNYGSDREKIENLKGVTYNLNGNSISKDKLDKSAIFEVRESNYYMLNKFTLPNIKPGSVIEYAYTISSPFSQIDNIDLQYTIPIKKEVVEVRVPEYYVYRNYGNPQATLNYNYEAGHEDIKIELRERSGLGTADYNPGRVRNKSNAISNMVTYKENQYRLEESNIPPLKREVYVDNINNYRAKSIWELAVVNFPNEVPKTYSTDWESVTKRIYENDNFVNELNKKDYFAGDVAQATNGLTDPLQIAAALFGLARNKITWDGGYGYYPDKGVKKAYKEGTGNVAEINLMLVSMLRSANLNANPVLVSTKAHGIPVFPTLQGFNYVIAGLEFNGKLYLMDASAPFSSINLLPGRAMNWQGRLIKADGTSTWVGLYPDFLSQNITYAQAEIRADAVTVNVRERLTGHLARKYRTAFAGANLETQLESLQPDADLARFESLEVKELNSGKPYVNLSFVAKSNAIVEEINDELYIAPMLFLAHLENPFIDETRDYPVFFGYPKSEKYNITLKIPDGYKVTSLPESSRATLEDGSGGYSFLIKESPGIIQLSVVLELKAPILLPEDYTYLKGMFSEITAKESEKIVLSKI